MVDFECTIEQVFKIIQLVKNELDCLIWTESFSGKSLSPSFALNSAEFTASI